MSANNLSVHRGMRIWLISLCLLILGTVIVGGITRLTESGLSMVDWKPIVGAIPPLSEADWSKAFAAYQKFPQFQQVNHAMTLSEFKFIFFWEYLHRNLGRLIGVAFFVPFAVFFIRRRIPRPLMPKLLLGFVLGGLQGALGWYMVKSGLVDMPRVSHYRLAAHLSLALFIMVYLFWLTLRLWPKVRWGAAVPAAVPAAVKKASFYITGLVALQIVYGAFTAGLRAGIGFNTFPKMNGFWLPPGLDYLQPVWTNMFANPVTVQFIHRCIAWCLLAAITCFWFFARRRVVTPAQRFGVNGLMAMIVVQFLLGVMTLLHMVPVSLASMHQLGACVLLLLAVFTNFSFSRYANETFAMPVKANT